MKYKIQFSRLSIDDLIKIETWYQYTYDSKVANSIITNILDTIQRLETFPYSGSLTHDEWLNIRGYRMVICKQYIAFYRILDDIVLIERIVNSRNDYNRLF